MPAVNDLPPGWATALDLPVIPGAGTVCDVANPTPGPGATGSYSEISV